MTYSQLKAFHAVALTGGFSKAAARLALTQPAISDHVRKLEEHYGVQLLVRRARGVALTDLGRQLFAIIERQFEAEVEARDLLSRAQALQEGQLTIGADAAVHVLPQLARFKARYPGIAVRLVAGNSAELLSRLADFSIDFAVTADRPSAGAIAHRKLREDPLVAVGSVKAFPGRRASVTFAEFAAMPQVLREEGSATRRILMAEVQGRGLRLAHVTEVEGREAAREAAAQGLGVAVMSRAELADDGRLRALRFSDWPVAMEEWLAWLSSRAGLHVIRAFLDTAR